MKPVRLLSILVCLGLLLPLTPGRALAQSRQERARLLSVQGLVKLRAAGAAAWERAVLPARASLAGGDELQTYQRAGATLGMDSHRFVLGPLTHVTIPSAPASPRTPSRLHLLAGRLLIWIIGARPLEIGTAGAVAAAKSTQFAVEAGAGGETVLTVLEGSVVLSNDLGSVLVQANEQSTAAPGRAPSRPSRVDPSTLREWEATLDSAWLGFEKLYQPNLSREAQRARAEQARQRAAAAPADPAAQLEAADALHDLGDLDAAESYYLKAGELQPADPATQLKLGYNMLQQGHPVGDTVRQFEAAGRAGTAPAVALAAQALALAASRETSLLDRAADLAAQAVAASPTDPEALLAQGLVAIRRGEAATAQDALGAAARQTPADYRVLAYLSLVQLAAGKRDEALAAARQAVASAPASALAHQSLGTATFYAGDLKEARAEARLATELNASSALAQLLASDVAAAEGDLDGALTHVETALVLDPRLAPAHLSLGMIALAENDLPRAEKAFTAALRYEPKLVAAQTGLGLTWTRQDRFAEALQLQEGAASLDPGQASVRNNLGLIYLQTGRLPEAIAAFKQALERQPDWGLAQANLALAYLESNQYAQALQASEAAVRCGAESARLRTTRARVHLRQNRVNAAWAELRRALQLDDGYALAHMHLAEVYVRLGRTAEATKERLRGLSLQPSVMVDNRNYARTELEVAAGDGYTATGKTMGRSADGQSAYYAAVQHGSADGDRARSDSRETSALVIAGRQTGDKTALVYASAQKQDQERPGQVQSGGLPSDDDYTGSFHGQELQLLSRRPLGRDGAFTLRTGWRASHYADNNPDSMVGDAIPFRRAEIDQSGPMAEVRLDQRCGRSGELVAGAAWLHERNALYEAFGDPALTPNPSLGHRQYGTGYLEYTKALDARTSALLGGRLATADEAKPVWRPKLSLRREVSRGGTLVLLTRPVLADDVSELSPVDEYALRPFVSPLDLARGGYEQSYELQYVRLTANEAVLRLALFHRDLRNLLVDLEDPRWSTTTTVLLLGSAAADGLEAELDYPLGRDLTGGLWLRYTDSQNDDAGGAEIPGLPQWAGQARLDYLDAAGWRLGAAWAYGGKRYADAANTLRLPSYGVLNLNLARQCNLHTDLFLAISNALDRQYEVYDGYPAPGRQVQGGLRYRF